MIATLTGTVQSIDAVGVILEVSGVGYRVMLSGRDAQQCTQDTRVRVYTYHHIREDAQQLFGFLDVHDLRVFERLISVSGVGPKIAQAILSQLSGVAVIDAILTQNITQLKSISGVGKKTAERLIVELRDSLKKMSTGSGREENSSHVALSTHIDLVQALLALGYAEMEIHEVIKDVDASLSLSEQVRAALQLLSRTPYAR
ncbi:MAG: Holliday junction branch migration protein RuvA [Candidatus Kerfeldbacteria bacterium]|nr:Holliday junction branch migration protein RuvA [Candidatus Kerfeldbacteria bacterium]